MRNQSRIPYFETNGVLVSIIISADHELTAFLNLTCTCITYIVQISIFTSVVRRTGQLTLSIPAHENKKYVLCKKKWTRTPGNVKLYS